MGWYFHLVKCYQFRCDQVENSVLISQACVHISQVEQLWKFQLGTPMTVRESPSQSAPTRIINPGSAAGSARLAWWGSCRNTWNPQLSIECWGCFPRVYWICRSKLIILQLGVVIEHCENKGFCCADTFCVLKYKHDLFPCAWKLIDHAFRGMSRCEKFRQPFLQLCNAQEGLIPQASSCLLLVWNILTKWRTANSEQVTSRVARSSFGADNWFFLPPGSLTQAGLWKNLLLLSVWQTATCLWGFSFQIFDVSVSLPSL